MTTSPAKSAAPLIALAALACMHASNAQPYPLKDFAPVSLVALTHSLLLVNPSVPVKAVKELIDELCDDIKTQIARFAQAVKATGMHAD